MFRAEGMYCHTELLTLTVSFVGEHFKVVLPRDVSAYFSHSSVTRSGSLCINYIMSQSWLYHLFLLSRVVRDKKMGMYRSVFLDFLFVLFFSIGHHTVTCYVGK